MTQDPQAETQPQRRRISACNRHPEEPITGICPSCLRERLSRFDPTPGGEISAATTSFKSSGGAGFCVEPSSSSSAAFPPEIRRSKSVSAGKCEGPVEPRRRSCDVRARHSLGYLFDLDDEKRGMNGEIHVETKNLGFLEVTGTVFESREEYEDEEEIRVSEVNVDLKSDESIEEILDDADVKTMKEHIDLEWQSMKHNGRDLKHIADSFWMAASVFSKRLQKWQQRQKMRKRRKNNGDGSSLDTMPVERPLGFGRQLRDTQSEIGDYGFGRRSCDTDPRHSVDGGRMALDGLQHSFDEPRASWDGHFFGRSYPQLPTKHTVTGSECCSSIHDLDSQVEGQVNSVNASERTSNRARRHSGQFDCSSSERRMIAVEVDEVKVVSNSRVSPANAELFHGTKLLNLGGGELRDSNSNSVQDDCSGGSESASRDSSTSRVVCSNGKQFKFKNSGKWRKVWSFWGSTRRNHHGKCGDEDSCCYRGNVVDDAVVGRDTEGVVSGVLIRSKSCVGPRNSCDMAAGLQCSSSSSSAGGTHEMVSYSKKRRESVLERNQVPRHSPRTHDTGLLRFYLTPLRSCRRSKSQRGSGKGSRLRNILRFY